MFPAVSDTQWDNPYMSLLVRGLTETGANVAAFTWVRAFRSGYDVLHINWPERLVLHRPVGSLIRAVLTVSLFAVLRLRRVPVVVTVHNLAPHSSTPINVAITRFVYRFATTRIYLHRWSEAEASVGDGVYIPHGSYKTFLNADSSVKEPLSHTADLLLFGQLRPNKGIERLLTALSAVGGQIHLHIAGEPKPAAYATRLVAAVAALRLGEQVELTARRLTSSELLTLVRSCRAVLLPYDDLYNSGALMLALSAGKPVIATRSRSTEEMSALVGDSIQLLPAQWDGTDVARAVTRLPGSAAPLGAEFSWDVIAERHLTTYESARRRHRVRDSLRSPRPRSDQS